jgi:4-hydroxybenzoate polyprenyltransferase
MKDILEKIRILVISSRPLVWLLGPIIFFTGLKVGGGSLDVLSIIQLILMSFPLSIILYGVNDIYDYESDKNNKRKKGVQGVKLEKKYHSFVMKSAIFAALLIMLSSIVTLNLTNIIFTIITLFIAFFYSAKPLRLKERPPFDSISNGVAVFAVAMMGFSYGGILVQVPLKAYFVCLCAMGMHALTTIPDYSSDKKAKHKTFSIVFGKRAAALFFFITILSTFLFSGIKNALINYYLIFVGILGLIPVFKPDEKLTLKMIKLMVLGFIITAILYYF